MSIILLRGINGKKGSSQTASTEILIQPPCAQKIKSESASNYSPYNDNSKEQSSAVK